MTEVKKLVDDLDAKLGSLVTGPGSLGDIKDTIEALVDRLHQVNLDFLTTSLNELFADVRSKIEALDPANLAAALSADFDELLWTARPLPGAPAGRRRRARRRLPGGDRQARGSSTRRS